MKIEPALLAEHSKKQTLFIAKAIINSKADIKELIKLYTGKDQVIAQRAAWVVSSVASVKPELIIPFLKKIIKHLNKDGLHDAVIRNGVKILETIDFPKNQLGEITDLCFKILADQKQAIATRCYAMTTLSKICRLEPELKKELRLVIEEFLPFASAGFRSRSKRTLLELERL